METFVSINRELNEEKIHNLKYTRQLYFYSFLYFFIAFVWTFISINTQNLKDFYVSNKYLGVFIIIITKFLVLFVAFNKTIKESNYSVYIYIVFVLLVTYCYAFICSIIYLYFFVLCMATGLMFSLFVYSM